MNENGIDVNFVELCPKEEEGERQVIVSAKGDGEFSLRCYARNGGSSVSVQSMLMMEAEGFGKAFLDPYEEIPAGLCDVREGNCGEGILHGIGFLGEEKSVQVVEAPMQKEYGERTFALEEIRGKGSITFIFMPGSCFDFGWFRFEKTEKEK